MVERDADKLPLKLKLKAWWEGYDAQEFAERMGIGLGSEKDDEHNGSSASDAAAAPEPAAEDKEDLLAPSDGDAWSDARAAVSQLIWGEGYCGPGGSEQIISMTQLLALDPKMSMLVVGASLGGPARALSQNFGVWITGLEASGKLVQQGNEISKVKGMAKKVTLAQYDPEDVAKFDRNYDRIFAKESLFTVEKKKDLIAHLFDATKKEGLFLLTDYVLGSESVVMKEEFREWRDREPTRPFCVLSDELEGMVKNAGFAVRVSEDISKQYIDLISKAWKDAGTVVAELMKSEDGKHLIDPLLSEAEFWARRSKMLQSGQLQVWRILAYKTGGGGKMMSDW